MQSDGGLTPMDKFSGSRAILSGPAGNIQMYKIYYVINYVIAYFLIRWCGRICANSLRESFERITCHRI